MKKLIKLIAIICILAIVFVITGTEPTLLNVCIVFGIIKLDELVYYTKKNGGN